MSRDFVVDFETLGVEENSLILSIGICPCLEPDERYDTFNELLGNGLYLKLDKKEQQNLGRVINKETVIWWKEQSSQAREVINDNNVVSLISGYAAVLTFLKQHGFEKGSHIWSRGGMDQVWWSSLVRGLQKVKPEIIDPLPFYIWRDVRTALEILTGDPNGTANEPIDYIKHNSLHDSCMDFVRLYNAFKS